MPEKKRKHAANPVNKVKAPDRWVRLEAASLAARQRQADMALHGKVRIIIKDGVPCVA